MEVGAKKSYLILVIVVLLLHLPFINKAIHIDDTIFYYVSEQIMNTPADPYSFSMNWLGVPMRVFDFNSNPPGFSYYLSGVFSVFGQSEKTAHVSMIVFLFIAAFSMYSLARKFVPYPLAATLLFLFTPIYMIMSQTIMVDIPMVAFYILAITLFLYGREANNNFLLSLAGVSAGLAIMFKYNGLSIIPLCILSWLIYFNKERKHQILFIIIPILFFALWNFATWKEYGGSHFLTQVRFQLNGQGRNVWYVILHLLPHLTYLGMVCFPLLLFTFLIRKNRLDTDIGLTSILIGVLIYFVFLKNITRYTFWNMLLAVVFLAGILFLFSICAKSIYAGYRNKCIARDDLFLLLWIFIVLGMQNSGVHSTAKYMLPAIPPAVLLLVKYSTRLAPKKEVEILAATLAVMLCIGMTASVADYELAGIYREMARYVDTAVPREKEARVYFTGHWGFQYYMEKAGFLAYAQNSNALKQNDLLVTCALAWPQPVAPELARRLRLIQAKTFTPELPLRIMDNRVGEQANFYSFLNYRSVYGVLPFSIGKNPVEKVAVYKVLK